MSSGVPTEIDCEQCGKEAQYCVPMRRGGVAYDVYVCEDDHYTYVKSSRGSSDIEE